ncbi:hypothetical protein BOTBODRAFT_559051 [Botryobasidium botryosum FD-172 SS1]|uniref:Uncharacterized protein n=1 Tax=Botryobasidium botryosum (strain FD-172 SS1) TaxID=930990 RepID=A0A067MAD9_BOTB1|nr:hypothetical protein BOTBODRAFT_559051 [Botryobasidium botryosum FD-172 SS1]
MPTASADTNANTHTGVVNWGRDVDQDSRDHRESRDSKDGWENRDSRERDEKEREKKDLPTRPRAMATNTAPLLASVPPPAPALNHYRQRPIPPHLASGDNTGMRTGPRGGGGSGVKRSFADADGPEPMNVQPQPQRQQQLQPPAPTPASTAAAEAYARRSMEMDREGDKEREKERVEQRHSPEFSVQNRVADSKEPPVLRARNPPPRRGRGGGITGGPGASAPGAPASGPKIRVTGANDMPLTNRRPFGKAATPSASQQQEAFSAPPPEVTPRSMDVDIRESQRERTDRRDKERDRDRNSGAFEGHGVSRSPPEDFAMVRAFLNILVSSAFDAYGGSISRDS